MSRFVHYAHCSKLVAKPGQYVKRGEVIARVGNSGASSGSHSHLEGLWAKPATWWRYVRGMSFSAVQKAYFDVTKFYDDKKSIPIAHRFPSVGYKFLQFVREAGIKVFGGYWHPGDDVNGLNDYGAELRSLFNGRVVFFEDYTWVRNSKGQLVKTDYNGGWGQHLWIEVNEADPGV